MSENKTGLPSLRNQDRKAFKVKIENVNGLLIHISQN